MPLRMAILPWLASLTMEPEEILTKVDPTLPGPRMEARGVSASLIPFSNVYWRHVLIFR
jgi:hypothetical protein